MESFKYKGTPEQMQKVADYLLAQGYEWADDDREGEYIHFDKIGGDFFYGVLYGASVAPEMPASLELEIFGSTSNVTGKVENEWLENTGMPNLKDGTKVDYLMVKGYYCNGKYATSPVETLDWDYTLKSDWTITHWRLHKADEGYFQQPETMELKMKNGSTIEFTDKPAGPTAEGKIKSDGGSSDYYKLTIKTKGGSFDCETGDVIAAMVGDNFALGNALKALRRIYCASIGMGKDGIDARYDQKKIQYFVADFIERMERV